MFNWLGSLFLSIAGFVVERVSWRSVLAIKRLAPRACAPSKLVSAAYYQVHRIYTLGTYIIQEGGA